MTTSQASHPPTTLEGPWESALCHGRVKHGRPCRTFSTLQQHSPTFSTLQQHSPRGCTSDCDLLQLHCRPAQMDSWLGQLCVFITAVPITKLAIWYRRHRRYDTTTMMSGPLSHPCSESVAP